MMLSLLILCYDAYDEKLAIRFGVVVYHKYYLCA